MKSRFSIRAWFAVLFVLTVAMGVVAIAGFQKTSLYVSRAMEEMQRTFLLAAKISALAEQHRLVVTAAIEQPDPAACCGPLAGIRDEIASSLAVLERLPILQTQTAVFARVRATFAIYECACTNLLAAPLAERRRWLDTSVAPAFAAMRAAAERLEALNALHIQHTEELLRDTAREQSILVASIGLLALIISHIVYQQLKTSLIDPLTAMRDFIERYVTGDRYTRLPVQQYPDLSALAYTINRLMERIEIFVEQTNSRAQLHRQFASSLIEMYTPPVVIVDNGFQVRLCNEAARRIFAEKDGQAALDAFEAVLQKEEPFVWRTVTYTLDKKPLNTSSGYNCGSLIELRAAPASARPA